MCEKHVGFWVVNPELNSIFGVFGIQQQCHRQCQSLFKNLIKGKNVRQKFIWYQFGAENVPSLICGNKRRDMKAGL